MRRVGKLVMSGVVLLSPLVLSGCLLRSHNESRVSGTQVSPHALATLVVDETTEAQLLERLGTPTRTMPAEGSGVIYVWESTRVEESAGALLFVFGGSTEKVEQRSTSVLVRDGLVRSCWSG
ncbi:MAG: hypothetical protein Tsb0013_04830 [Phycisphaerales bacterium]